METIELKNFPWNEYRSRSYLDGSEANIYVSFDSRKLLKKFKKCILINSLENKSNYNLVKSVIYKIFILTLILFFMMKINLLDILWITIKDIL